ncbi:MAG: hypothetical protein EA356_07520 [Geminicoccaceae bacterium]|nr:MAG: hypothetical protein EA356_07520 [Geminicoccaceae bacterium]
MTPTVLADDVTGALDTGVAFAAPDQQPLTVHLELPDRIDGGVIVVPTREASPAAAITMTRAVMARLAPQGLVFKKIDSLLRGHWALELATMLAGHGFRRCVLAPAFPAQHRVTVDGRQWLRQPDGSLTPVGASLLDRLQQASVRGALWRAGTPPPQAPVLVADAGTDDDLRTVVDAAATLPGPVLWCGTSGLARALGHPPTVRPDVPTPCLALIGTAHPTTLGQVAALRASLDDHMVALRRGDDTALARLAARPAMVVTFPIAAGADADREIESCLRWLLPRLAPPRTLFVTGGETLLRVARVLEVERLAVEAEWVAGVPWSRLVGGPWHDVAVLSKSGAFGERDLLPRMVRAALQHSDCF